MRTLQTTYAFRIKTACEDVTTELPNWLAADDPQTHLLSNSAVLLNERLVLAAGNGPANDRFVSVIV